MIKPVQRGTGTKIVSLWSMEPYEIGRIILAGNEDDIGEIVMRSASEEKFEVFSLSRPDEGKYWSLEDGDDDGEDDLENGIFDDSDIITEDLDDIVVALFPSGTAFRLEVE